MSAALSLEPIAGVKARAFLGRVVAAGGSLPALRNGERDAGAACVNAGILVRDRRDDHLFHITGKGADYHRRLLQAH